MNNFIVAVILFQIFVFLCVIFFDVYRDYKLVVFNLNFYILFFAVFYYGIPFVNIEYLYDFFGYNISPNAIFLSKLYSIWTVFVFGVGYLVSRYSYEDIRKNAIFFAKKFSEGRSSFLISELLLN